MKRLRPTLRAVKPYTGEGFAVAFFGDDTAVETVGMHASDVADTLDDAEYARACAVALDALDALEAATFARRDAPSGCCDWSCPLCSSALTVLTKAGRLP